MRDINDDRHQPESALASADVIEASADCADASEAPMLARLDFNFCHADPEVEPMPDPKPTLVVA